jgi:hypothetical protein
MTTPNPGGAEEPPSRLSAVGEATALRLLADLRAEAGRADGKASLLIGALGMTVGVLAATLGGRPERLSGLSMWGAAGWWLGCAGWAAALACWLLAVLPRYGAENWAPGRPLTYFGDIRRAAAAGHLTAALAQAELDPMPGLVLGLAENSRIVASKHQWVRRGLLCFAIGSLALPIALLVD